MDESKNCEIFVVKNDKKIYIFTFSAFSLSAIFSPPLVIVNCCCFYLKKRENKLIIKFKCKIFENRSESNIIDIRRLDKQWKKKDGRK